MKTLGSWIGAAALVLACASSASAFCGFYVSGAETSLYANATMVVLMRSGTRTVLSMQNNYQGPPEDFAMVVPVPVVLQRDNVKTLPASVFERVDSLAAPRLVEYWEADPCRPPQRTRYSVASARTRGSVDLDRLAESTVHVEARFEVGEYDVVILSASDSTGLDTWLRANGYRIPEGAEPVLRPYVAAGTKFFVAKVDVERVRFVDGRAVLSPLRFHYDTPEFSLPVRLGLLNSRGSQDLVVHVLAPTRYEVANYRNVPIPTNLVVPNATRHSFAHYYEQLFSRITASEPRTVVTEYAWSAGSCDPCPTNPLDASELSLLGADVIEGVSPYQMVLTRLHYRYGPGQLGDDLVFRAASPIVGGRGIPDASGHLPTEIAPSSVDNFQARYVILHRYQGAIRCEHPSRGQWGGPEGGRAPAPTSARNTRLFGSQGATPSAPRRSGSVPPSSRRR